MALPFERIQIAFLFHFKRGIIKFQCVPLHLQSNASFMIFVSLSSQKLLDEVISSLLNLYLSVISHKHSSRTRSKALRRWYLWVVHQAWLPLLIHIAVKRCNASTLMNTSSAILQVWTVQSDTVSSTVSHPRLAFHQAGCHGDARQLW